MKTAALVAPVTALEFLSEDYLLIGEGPFLTVYSLHPHPKSSAILSVLKHYRIHGIRLRPPAKRLLQNSDAEQGGSSTTESNHYDLVVFGGKAVQLLRLTTELHGEDHQRLEAQGPLMELQDWILDVRWLTEDRYPLLGVALAHNSALLLEAHEGTTLVKCSCQEGCLLYSALLLVGQSWVDSILVGGTVFNQLVLWRPGSGIENKSPVERRLLGHSGVIFSISYLQEKGWLASASDDRSVRVWGVGVLGGPHGKCGDSNPICLRVLYGHQARVFSVHLSPGKVYSAGEDGTCLVWDWANGAKVVRTLKGHRAGGVRALAVSTGKADQGKLGRWVATGGADGGVKLWKVDENKEKEKNKEEAEGETETLSDLKFSGQGMPKAVCVLTGEDGNSSWTQSKVVVCTDLGVVYRCYSNGQWEPLWQGTPEFQSYCVMETLTVGVKDSPFTAHLCAVGNRNGGIQVFSISEPQSGVLLKGGEGKIHSLTWVEGQERHSSFLLASGANGLVHRWYMEVEMDEKSCLVLNAVSLPPFLLPPCAKRWLNAAVLLHKGPQGVLWVCGDRRGSLLLFQERMDKVVNQDSVTENFSIIARENDKGEGMDNENKNCQNGNCKQENKRRWSPLQSLSCLFGVHGKQGVTSVCEHLGIFYSCGRDGYVRIFRISPVSLEPLSRGNKPSGDEKSSGVDGTLRLEMLRVQRACRGMEWLERVLILETECSVECKWEEEHEGQSSENHYMTNERIRMNKESVVGGDERENVGRECRFVIAGFHSAHFVVWDPVKQARLLAVPCGGGHRSWSLWPPCRGLWPGYGALVFIKQGAVISSQSPTEELVGKARALGLREGLHGRGIGCVCRLGSMGGTGNEKWEVVVTGGEDTSLTVLAVQPNSGTVQVLSVITDHISSVRTLTTVTRVRIGRRSLSALLVSAGGRAQIQCYRLLIGWDGQRRVPSCQVIQVARHRLDEQWESRRNRHKMVKMDPETRYMSVAVLEEDTDSAHLALACSDGAVRLFLISEVKGDIDLQWESFYHQRCVLSVSTCCLHDGSGNRFLFSAATDGNIAVWDLTAASTLLTSGLGDAPLLPNPCLSIPAHQNGVNSLAVWVERTQSQEAGCLVTVASGGDDGQLSLSVIRVQYPEVELEDSTEMPETEDGQHQTQTHISPQVQFQSSPLAQQPWSQNQTHPAALPRLSLLSQSCARSAHAAPLTALGLLAPGLLVSTSPDQRVCLWKMCSTGIHHTGTIYSHVADAAGLAAWGEGESMSEIREERQSEEKCETAALPREVRQTGFRASETESETGSCETDGNSEPGGDRGCGSRGETGSKTSREAERVGWVLVCGQGFQLLKVENAEMERENGDEKRNKNDKVTNDEVKNMNTVI